MKILFFLNVLRTLPGLYESHPHEILFFLPQLAMGLDPWPIIAFCIACCCIYAGSMFLGARLGIPRGALSGSGLVATFGVGVSSRPSIFCCPVGLCHGAWPTDPPARHISYTSVHPACTLGLLIAMDTVFLFAILEAWTHINYL